MGIPLFFFPVIQLVLNTVEYAVAINGFADYLYSVWLFFGCFDFFYGMEEVK